MTSETSLHLDIRRLTVYSKDKDNDVEITIDDDYRVDLTQTELKLFIRFLQKQII
jgi:hypothetical protein